MQTNFFARKLGYCAICNTPNNFLFPWGKHIYLINIHNVSLRDNDAVIDEKSTVP